MGDIADLPVVLDIDASYSPERAMARLLRAVSNALAMLAASRHVRRTGVFTFYSITWQAGT